MTKFTTITLRDGAVVRAKIAGTGPPLLLLSNMASWEFWHQQIPFFAQHYQVIAPEYRNQPIPGVTALDALASDIPDMLQAFGHTRGLLMGHSIGAMVIARQLEVQPDIATAVVLANGFLQLRLLPYALHRLLHRLQPGLVPLLWQLYPRTPWLVRQLMAFAVLWGTELIFLHREPNSAKRRMFFGYTNTPDPSMVLRVGSALEYHQPPDLSRARVPALVVSGGSDHWMHLWEARRLTELLPCGEQVVFPGIGHMLPMIVPDEFNRVVLQFLQRVAPAGAGGML